MELNTLFSWKQKIDETNISSKSNLREEANNMYEICCSYYKKERHLENMDDAVMLSFDYLGENTAYITDCDDKVWTWEIIED